MLRQQFVMNGSLTGKTSKNKKTKRNNYTESNIVYIRRINSESKHKAVRKHKSWQMTENTGVVEEFKGGICLGDK